MADDDQNSETDATAGRTEKRGASWWYPIPVLLVVTLFIAMIVLLVYDLTHPGSNSGGEPSYWH